MSDLTDRERDILRHTLGVNRKSRPYRNHFCADCGSEDIRICHQLVDRGLMVSGEMMEGGLVPFGATKAGMAVVGVDWKDLENDR